jgi:3-oxoacyl-[acyl-carrier protein] reductase
VLVANAGIAIDGLLLRLKDEDLDKLFNVNVRGAITCARVATRSMMRTRKGRVIFLSSVVGEMGNVGQTAYAATKAALLGVTKSLAREFASRNITVNAVAPGFIDTDMTSSMNDKMKEELVKMVPLGRTGTAKEVAAACAFLASEEAGYITGQVLRVNGGMYV